MRFNLQPHLTCVFPIPYHGFYLAPLTKQGDVSRYVDSGNDIINLLSAKLIWVLSAYVNRCIGIKWFCRVIMIVKSCWMPSAYARSEAPNIVNKAIILNLHLLFDSLPIKGYPRSHIEKPSAQFMPPSYTPRKTSNIIYKSTPEGSHI